MAAAFSRTLAALRADRRRAPLVGFGVALAILASWLAWGALASVSVYRSSTQARIEVDPAPARIASPVSGRVTVAHLQIDAPVAAGEILVELDATTERIALDRAQLRIAALAPQVDSIERELVAEDAGGRDGRTAELDTEGEVRARLRVAEADLAFAERDLAREQVLAAKGASPEVVRERAETVVKQRRATLDAIAHEADAMTATHRERNDGRRGRREQLQRQRAELASEVAAARAERERLDHELARKTIRAPIAGVLGEVAALQPGAVLKEGDIVTTIVPTGKLRVVAAYGVVALGRLVSGQRARIRLDGFPWTRFGTVAARVTRVATELRDGTIRVELELDGAPAIPVHHGMTGIVDVEIERASPIALLLRAVGEGLDEAGGS